MPSPSKAKPSKLKDLLKLVRAHQWYKNGVIALPWLLIQGQTGLNPDALPSSLDPLAHTGTDLLIAFLGFCAISSITYIINDWLDREKDRLHPTKRNRPLAAGRLNGKTALLTGFILAIGVLLAGMHLGIFYSSTLALYFVLTNAYSLGLKNIPLLDMLMITSNFILRAIAGISGGLATALALLPHLSALAGIVLLSISHKRFSDRTLLGADAIAHKPVLKWYTHHRLHLIWIGCALLLAASFHTLLQNGLAYTPVLAFIVWLIDSSVRIHQNPQLTLRPSQFLRHPEWTLLALINFGLFLMESYAG